MQKQKYFPVPLATALLIASGCASANVDPPHPHLNTGYVDLYSPTDDGLCWDVAAATESDTHFQTVFMDVKPVEGDLLRLKFTPRQVRLKISFLNRVVTKPAIIDCEVRSGEITPVAVSLNSVGQTTVFSKQTSMAGTGGGASGRRTKITSDETVRFDIEAVAGPSVPYQPKNQTHYTR
jgi:hypothetical protein